MKRLILLRHAKTERRSASGEDCDRALTDEGRRAAALVGRALAAGGLVPDVALVSPALRAQQTFEALQPALADVSMQTVAELYNASAGTLRSAADAVDTGTVLVVAHNPGVHALALSLIEACVAVGVDDRARVEDGFPTGTAAAFEFVGGRTACLGVFPAAGSSQ